MTDDFVKFFFLYFAFKLDRGGNSRFDDSRSSSGRVTPGHRSSSRSTTRSNNSPQPMELGDATPLYDE